MGAIFLQGYLQRIGYLSQVAEADVTQLKPDLALLNALTFGHTTHIPFENIAVLNKESISLEPAHLYEKLVVQRRGGYCFEQNGLFLAVLKQLGFQVSPWAARVRLTVSDRAILTNRTHLLLQVEIGGQAYITDVGVGSNSLTQAVALVPDIIQETPHDKRRFQYKNGQWYLQVAYKNKPILQESDWQDIYQFSGELMPMPDRLVANWYTSTHPHSHFTQDLTVAMAHADGSRSSVKNTLYTRRYLNGEKEQIEFSDKAALKAQLSKVFGLALNA